MGKHHRGKLYSDPYVHSIGFCFYSERAAYRFYPFTAASADRNDAFITFEGLVVTDYLVFSVSNLDVSYRSVEIKINFVFKFRIKILQNYKVDVGPQMSDRGVEKIEFVLDTYFFEF